MQKNPIVQVLYDGFCVNCILKIHGILNVLSSEYDKVLNVSGVLKCYIYIGFWIKYLIVYIPGFIRKTLYNRCLTGFWIFLRFWIYQDSKYEGLHKILKKCCTIDPWQDSEYSSGSEYGRVLNMAGLHKVLNKTLRYIDIWQGFPYASSS